MICLVSRKSWSIPSFLSQKTNAYHFSHWFLSFEHFPWRAICMMLFYELSFWFWHLVVTFYRKLSFSGFESFTRSWQSCIWWYCSSCVSICRTDLEQNLQYFNVASIISNEVKLTFNFVHSSLVEIQFVWRKLIEIIFFLLDNYWGWLEHGFSHTSLLKFII